MMQVMSVPPFERFYEEHRVEVMRLLRRRLGRERADDAFQETFLRALQAYGRLDHAEHLRAWVLTIARNVAIDTLRRTRPTQAEPTETPVEDETWMAKFTVMKENLEHHIEEEEGEMFKQARELLGAEELTTLAEQMGRRKEQAQQLTS